jgi:hypothetical protein
LTCFQKPVFFARPKKCTARTTTQGGSHAARPRISIIDGIGIRHAQNLICASISLKRIGCRVKFTHGPRTGLGFTRDRHVSMSKSAMTDLDARTRVPGNDAMTCFRQNLQRSRGRIVDAGPGGCGACPRRLRMRLKPALKNFDFFYYCEYFCFVRF